MRECSRRDHHLSLPPFLRGRPISLVWIYGGGRQLQRSGIRYLGFPSLYQIPTLINMRASMTDRD